MTYSGYYEVLTKPLINVKLMLNAHAYVKHQTASLHALPKKKITNLHCPSLE